MKYCQNTTTNHPAIINITGCLINLDTLIHNEDDSSSCVGNLFGNICVINLDHVELINAKNQKRNQNSTMDCTFGINNKNNTPHMLLVEFRFNYTRLKNLNRNKLIDKVSGSINLLGNSIPIFHDHIFIFHSNLKSQAKSRLFRMNPTIPINYQVMDLSELFTTFF